MSKLLIFRKTITKDSSRSSDSGTNVDFLAVPASSIANMSASLGEVVLTLKDGNDFSDQAVSNSNSTTLNFCNVIFTVTAGTELNVVNSIWKNIYGDSDTVYFDGVNSVYPIKDILSIKSIIRTTPPTSTAAPTTINVLSSTDAVLGTLDSSVPDTFKLMSTAISYSKVGDQGRVTTSAATPSGIAYQDSAPGFNVSFVSGDSWNNFTSGNYNRTNPTYPASYAKLDYDATQALVRGTPATGTSASDAVSPTILENNNAFGNKFRYTDDQGNASDASVSSNLWAHVDWNNHSWSGATQYYVIDHLTGFGFTVKYEDDSGKVNLNTSNNTWAEWLAYIDATHHGYTGWMPLDLGELTNAHGSRVQLDMVWADEFFEFDASVSGSTRGAFLTGESLDASNFYILYDSGNADLVLDLTKATNSGFHSRLTNCFMKRKHY